MIYVHWLILAVYFCLCAATMVAIVMDKKEPVKTMAWLLLLFFLPLVGCILYFFFGRNYRRQSPQRKIVGYNTSKSAEERYNSLGDVSVPTKYSELIKMFSVQNHAFPFPDNEVEIFTHGKDFFERLLHDINHAEHHIHLEFFIFEDDNIGSLIGEHLVRRAHDGVEVRVLYDDVGCWNVSNRFWERLREGGVDVHSFLPVRYPLFTSKINYRNHRKIIVIDGKIGYLGGMNVADRYVIGTRRQGFRDTQVRITGCSVYGIQKVFLSDWFAMDRTLLSGERYYPHTLIHTCSSSALIQVVASSAASQWPDIEQGYVKVLQLAKRYVYIETPYFLPTEPVLFAIQTAALGGVDVRIMVPSRCDNMLVNWASHSFFPDILKAGAKVWLYEPQTFNHSKVLVSDDELATVGSVNIDSRSFETSMEVQAFIYDKDIAVRFRRMFEEDMRHCEQLNAQQAHNRNFFIRLWESVVRMLSPLL